MGIGVAGGTGEELGVERPRADRRPVFERLGLGVERVQIRTGRRGGGGRELEVEQHLAGVGRDARRPFADDDLRAGGLEGEGAERPVRGVTCPRLAQCIGHPGRCDGLVDEALGVSEQHEILEGQRAGTGAPKLHRALREPCLDELKHPRLRGSEHRGCIGERVSPRLHLGSAA